MRRHAPTLFALPEQPNSDGDVDGDATQWTSIQQPYSATSGVSTKSRKGRSQNFTASPAGRNNVTFDSFSTFLPSSNTDVYSQFVKRYRSRPQPFYDSLDDPESSVYRGASGFTDDDSDEDRPGSSQGSSGRERFGSPSMENEHVEPTTVEERERLEWQSMLASVLDGDVLKSEKSRIQVALMNSTEGENGRHLDIWLGLRAKLRNRTVEEERKILEERKLHLVDRVINEILQFKVDNSPGSPPAFHQVNIVLQHLDKIHSFYPHLKAFYLDKPAAINPDFQARCDALTTWSTVRLTLRHQINILRKWTGSEVLDVTAQSSSPEHDGSTFVERLHKEETLQRTFEKGFLTTVHAIIASARDTQVNLADMFRLLNLPTFEDDLIQLISFPTRLVHASVRVRLDYASRVKDPDILIIDQMLEDLRLSIGLACTLKRQYEAFLLPDPGGNWNLPNCMSDDYDKAVLDALNEFFRFINYKLKSGSKDIYFRETEVLEAQWATFNDVSLSIGGGASLVAEQVCSITHRLMVRATNNFQRQVRIPHLGRSKDKQKAVFTPPQTAGSPSNGLGFDFQRSVVDGKGRVMTAEQTMTWYEKVLESVKTRCRKLQRFSRALSQRFGNAAEYSLENVSMDAFVAALVENDHFLVYTQSFEEEGTYIVASRGLRDKPDTIRQMLQNPYHVKDLWADGYRSARRPSPQADPLEDVEENGYHYDESAYLLILSPRVRFLWNGLVLMLPTEHVDFELKDNRARLVADGPHARLVLAKSLFTEVFMPVGDDGEPLEPYLPPLTCIVDQMAHLPSVNHELRKITYTSNRMAEAIVEAVNHIRKTLRGVPNAQEVLESWFAFASEHGQHAQKHMDRAAWMKFNRLLTQLAIFWVSFICDDCEPDDRRIFRWAVSALEFALVRTKRNNILHLPDEQFEMLRQKVASCMTLLISHFDILGARSQQVAKKEKEKQEEELRMIGLDAKIAAENEEDFWDSQTPAPEGVYEEKNFASFVSTGDRSLRRFRENILEKVMSLDERRAGLGTEQHVVGRVLDDQKPEDRSLMFLASASSNVSIRWQQGKYIGSGAFGSVYTAVNLDNGSVMAVKEIHVHDVTATPSFYKQIEDELRVMEMLHHPNIVEFYGIEVHRDKVYIFEEYCEGGSLASNLEVGRIADESVVQVYTMQMLEGLQYLHSRGIVHRDIKPDNILLDHNGLLKFVDFGAAKVIAKNTRTFQRTRYGGSGNTSLNITGMPSAIEGGFNRNSLTGTPMYMSPEVIKNDKQGRHGSMDIWSMGCVILECATGRKPWSNLDNEWAIMFHIGVATQHPPLPDPGELSELGISFIKQCLTVDPSVRPTATELMNHPWMVTFIETLRSYEEEELATSPPVDIPSEKDFQGATVARQAAILKEKEVEAINMASPPASSPESEST